MMFLARVLAGPSLWALSFTLVYALHGAGCALGWPAVDGPLGLSAHRMALVAAWTLGLALCAALLVYTPRGPGLWLWLPRAGAWTGLVATAFTLFPVALSSSC